MKYFSPTMTSRRQFIAKTTPAYLLTCAFGKDLFGMIPKIIPQDKPMFDMEYPRRLTYRQFITIRNRDFIKFAQAVKKTLGKEKTIDLIKQLATESQLETGRKQAQNSKDRSLKSYARMFSNPKDWEGLLRMEVVEDTETAFELKVTECVHAAVFINQNAADIGYAHVCWGDYAWAEGFNPKIKLIRDKTLMQGHDYCNHRYVWAG